MLYFRIPLQESEVCVAAIGVVHFSCVASAAHFLFVKEVKSREKAVCNTSYWHALLFYGRV